jgi:hypothetical protein
MKITVLVALYALVTITTSSVGILAFLAAFSGTTLASALYLVTLGGISLSISTISFILFVFYLRKLSGDF